MADEATLEAALAPFGWTCGPEFWQRYYADGWVFGLANAVERLTEQLAEAEMLHRSNMAAWGAEVVELTARVARQERANLVRAVADPLWEEHDGWVAGYIDREDFDAVPWRVATDLAESFRKVQAEVVRLTELLARERLTTRCSGCGCEIQVFCGLCDGGD